VCVQDGSARWRGPCVAADRRRPRGCVPLHSAPLLALPRRMAARGRLRSPSAVGIAWRRCRYRHQLLPADSPATSRRRGSLPQRFHATLTNCAALMSGCPPPPCNPLAALGPHLLHAPVARHKVFRQRRRRRVAGCKRLRLLHVVRHRERRRQHHALWMAAFRLLSSCGVLERTNARCGHHSRV